LILKKILNRQESTLARSTAGGFQTLMLITCFAALVLGGIVATLIARNISRALGGEPKEASAIARSIASGDLSIDIQVDARDQTSVLSAMKEMRDSLVSIVGFEFATQIRFQPARQKSPPAIRIYLRTEQQATSLENISTSMSELTSTVKQNADNAKQAIAGSDCIGRCGQRW
jgi:methyl-accepting chemotaxis protein